jgi:hypothetical protein
MAISALKTTAQNVPPASSPELVSPAAYLPAAELVAGQLLAPANQSQPPTTRLVVLVPDEDLDEAALARQVWKLAALRQLAVVYLGWTASADTEARVRRRLANLAALTRDDKIVVSTRPALGAGWLPAIRGVWRAGDLVVAHSEQRVVLGGVFTRPLGPALLTALKAPVYVLTGFCPAPERPAKTLAAQVLTGGMFALLVAAFFVVQVSILRMPGRVAPMLLVALSVLVEFGLLWGWNNLSA